MPIPHKITTFALSFRMKKILAILIITLLTISLPQFLSCKKDQDTKGLTSLTQEIPSGFPQPLYKFEDNPLSEEGFQLGRRLFYDGRLSADTQHACASCHQQVAAFGTFAHDRSHGVHDSHTLRNAPSLFNLAWSPVLHWDGAYKSLLEEAYQPITGHVEMGENFENIIGRLQADPDYRERFKKVFKYPFIRPEFISKALAQFTGTMVSANSRFDQFKKGSLSLNSQELSGYQIYKDKCASCHPEPLFTDFSMRNNGLPIDNVLKDYGRMLVTGDKTDSLKFKVPSLRNLAFSANYMHDGRFITLGQTMNHYRTNVQAGPTLDPLLTGGVSLTNSQNIDLIEFLRTLTDSGFIRNTRFSNPF